MAMPIAMQQKNHAETTRIVQAQAASMIKLEFDMIVVSPGATARHSTQASRHAEMNQHRRAATAQQQVFAAPAHHDDRLTPKFSGQPRRHRIPQMALIHVRGNDAVPANQFLKRPAGGLDFGKLRH